MPAAATSPHDPALAIATLVCWAFTASLGALMLRSLIARDGLRRQLGVRGGLHPGVLVAHFSLALTGLVTWICYLVTAAEPVAWIAVGLLVPGIGMGITTVTLWTPYPHPAGIAQPAEESPGHGPPVPAPPTEKAVRGRLTDEALARTLADEALTRKLIDDMIASLPAEAAQEAKKPKSSSAGLIPIVHGLGAVVTFALAVVTAAGMR
jgi:hypothetical protein